MFIDNMIESNLAPLIDKVMSDNEGIYIKSHVYVKSHVNVENKPHIEVHLTLRANEDEKPADKLLKAARELASLVEENDGKTIIEQ